MEQIRHAEAKTWIAAAAFAISLISLILTLREKRKSRHESIIKALQGEKEAVAYIALRIRKHGLSRNRSDREDIITSLCLAWLQESSDRARALLLSALIEVNKKHPIEVKTVLDDMNKQFDEYVKRIFPNTRAGDENMERGRRKIKELSDALNFDDNLKADSGKEEGL